MDRTAVTLLALLTGGAWALSGQEKPVPAEAGEPIVFRSDVALARVDAQVLDGNRRPITTLRQEDFQLWEGGEAREIVGFGREDVPLDVLILLDVSGSMRPHVEKIASATREALLVLSRRDRVAIMVFDRQTRVSMPFRSNQDEIVRGMEAVLSQEDFNGGTDITRALFSATSYMKTQARSEARRAIVILTDDRTERERDVQGVVRALGNANTILSALITPDAMGNRGGIQIPTSRRGGGGTIGQGSVWDDIIFGRRMPTGGGRIPGGGRVGGSLNSAGTAEIARNSGGDSMEVDDASALEAALEKIRQSYALYFNAPEGGRGRELEVRLTAQAARRYPGAELNYRRNYQLEGPAGGASGGNGPTVTQSRRVPEPDTSVKPDPDEENTRDKEAPPTMRRRRPAVDDPSSEKAPPATGEEAKAEGTSKGGFRRLKPGEKP